MNTLEAIRSRRSIRKFKDQKVDHAVIEDIIADTLGFAYNTGTIAKAPQLVVLTAIRGRSGMEKDGSATTDKGESWLMFDTGIAAQTFCLAAAERGVGSVIMGIFDADKVAELLHIPENETVVCLIPIGYPDETPVAPRRKAVRELVTFCE